MLISPCSASSWSKSTKKNLDADKAVSLSSISNGFTYLFLSGFTIDFPEFPFQFCKAGL